MTVERVVVNTPATLRVTFFGDETPQDADGAVTLTATKEDGTVLLDDVATVKAGTGIYTYNLVPQAAVENLSCVWAGVFAGVAGQIETEVEIVGGRFFTLAEARASDQALASTTAYPTALLSEYRTRAEDEMEEWTGRAFVHRFRKETFIGEGYDTLVLEKPDISEIRKVYIDGVDMAVTYPTFGASLDVMSGILTRRDGVWTRDATVEVYYVHGMRRPPSKVKDAALDLFKARLVARGSGIPDRATSWSAGEGGYFTLATPGRRGSITGIPDVDVVIRKYAIGGAVAY